MLRLRYVGVYLVILITLAGVSVCEAQIVKGKALLEGEGITDHSFIKVHLYPQGSVMPTQNEWGIIILVVAMGLAILWTLRIEKRSIRFTGGIFFMIIGLGLYICLSPEPIDAQQGSFKITYTDSDGNFTFQNVDPGLYTVQALYDNPWVDAYRFNLTVKRYGVWYTGTLILNLSPEGMSFVRAGWFFRGTNEPIGNGASPQCEVYLDGYFIDKFEVTIESYTEFLNATDPDGDHYNIGMLAPDWCGIEQLGTPGNYTYREWAHRELFPVTRVSYEDCLAYADWADKRMPTEAEWEKASRGNDQRRFPWGNIFAPLGIRYCNSSTVPGYPDENFQYTCRVNEYGNGISYYRCYNMVGNVEEWVADGFNPLYYQESCSTGDVYNPFSPPLGPSLVLRGGNYDSRKLRELQCSSRSWDARNTREGNRGFRCAKDYVIHGLYPSDYPQPVNPLPEE